MINNVVNDSALMDKPIRSEKLILNCIQFQCKVRFLIRGKLPHLVCLLDCQNDFEFRFGLKFNFCRIKFNLNNFLPSTICVNWEIRLKNIYNENLDLKKNFFQSFGKFDHNYRKIISYEVVILFFKN